MNRYLEIAETAKSGAPRTPRGACLLLLRALGSLIAGWWRSDRVLISPREGELLRMQPGSLFTVNGMVAEVRSKTVFQGCHATRVEYACQTDLGPALLEVQCPDDERRFQVVWSGVGGNRALLEHQIEVFR